MRCRSSQGYLRNDIAIKISALAVPPKVCAIEIKIIKYVTIKFVVTVAKRDFTDKAVVAALTQRRLEFIAPWLAQ